MTNIFDRWLDYRPSKAVWLWSCVASVILTLIVGFSFAGWVTSSTAKQQSETATNAAVAQLAANICTHRVLVSSDAQVIYQELEDMRNWDRRKYLDEAGWTTFANAEDPIDGAAQLCAQQILAADLSELKTDAALAGVEAEPNAIDESPEESKTPAVPNEQANMS